MSINDKIYPLKLTPFQKETVWGGEKLAKLFGKGSSESLGETWEMSVRNDENSYIKNGSCAGMTLKEYIKKHTDYSPEHFPLLIKFIDAKDDLSIQVHPDDTFARSIGEKNGKTEMWYVIDAEEDGEIVYGALPHLDGNDIKDSLMKGDPSVLNRQKVSAGDVIFIPGGMIHAIGKGVLIAEIQQNSDTTFRLYDYERKDKDGNLRPLHTEQAAKAFKSFTEKEIRDLRFSKCADDRNGELLASCDFFTVTIHEISKPTRFDFSDEPFISLLCIEGDGVVGWGRGEEEIRAGDSFYIPQELGSFNISGRLKLLATTV